MAPALSDAKVWRAKTNDKWHAGYFLTRDLFGNFYKAVGAD